MTTEMYSKITIQWSLYLASSYEGTDIIERYDPVLDKWVTDLEPIQSKRSGIAATSIDGSIYVLGGERRRGTFDNNERFNSVTNTCPSQQCQLQGMD